MPKIKIIWSKKCLKKFQKLEPPIKEKAKQAFLIFSEDPFSKQIKTHKLNGKLSNYYAFSIDYTHRVMFHPLEDNTFEIIDVGDHSIYE